MQSIVMQVFTYYIDNRRIRIIHSYLKNKFINEHKALFDNITKDVLELCSEYPLARNFSTVNFLIESINPHTFFEPIAYVNHFKNPDETAGVLAKNEWFLRIGRVRTTDTICINIDSLIAHENESGLVLKNCIVHEMIHLWHNIKSRYSSIGLVESRFSSKLSPKKYVLDLGNNSSLRDIIRNFRELLFRILGDIVREGLAMIGSELFSDNQKICFTESVWREKYGGAANTVSKLNKKLEQCFNAIEAYLANNPSNDAKSNMKILQEINSVLHEKIWVRYLIGEHIIHTILYFNKDMDMEQVINMDYTQIIREYEKCMIEKRQTPVISYSSGKGLFDYASTLAKLNKYYELSRNN
jgi:hypothetical protein